MKRHDEETMGHVQRWGDYDQGHTMQTGVSVFPPNTDLAQGATGFTRWQWRVCAAREGEPGRWGVIVQEKASPDALTDCYIGWIGTRAECEAYADQRANEEAAKMRLAEA